MLDDFQNELTEWEVELAISGAITLERSSLVLEVLKGELAPFTTTATLSRNSQGVRCILVARSYDETNANDAAVYFVGQALDVLSLRFNTPLYLNLFHPEFRDSGSHVKRRVSEFQWLQAFEKGREYSLYRHYFSRAISWYRKGLVSDDPIDKVIAFWSALESIGSNYFRESERTSNKVINQVCDCFDQLWGPVESWKVIPNNPKVVNKFHEFRNGFSHGYMRVDIEIIRNVVNQLPVYQDLVHEFLIDWEREGRDIELQHRTDENFARL
jgi:hypothetical protein